MFRNEAHERRRQRQRVLRTHEVAAATRFYCGALRGRQLCRAGGPRQRRRLWFRVGGAIIETGLGWRARARMVLAVDDPDETAERCWDAGFSVQVHDRGAVALSVVDPFGRQIDLVPLENTLGDAAAAFVDAGQARQEA